MWQLNIGLIVVLALVGHCVSYRPPIVSEPRLREYITVSTGHFENRSISKGYHPQEVNVDEVIFQEGSHDVAILILAKPIDMNDPYVQTICLPKQNVVFFGSNCFTVHQDGFEPQLIGIQVSLTHCKKSGDENDICIISAPRSTTIKIGTPVVCSTGNDGSRYVQAGLLSYSQEPIVFFNVSSIRGWIDSTFAKYIYTSRFVLPTTTDTTIPVPKPIEECGKISPQFGTKILEQSGDVLTHGKFPWMVTVTILHPTHSEFYWGTLIHRQAVLTDSVGMRGLFRESVKVSTAHLKDETTGKGYHPQEIDVHDIFISEAYAIMILSEPIDLSDPNVQTICLPKQNATFTGSNCFIAVPDKVESELIGIEVFLTPCANPGDSRLICFNAPTRLPELKPGLPVVCSTGNDGNGYVQAGFHSYTLGSSLFVNVASFGEWIDSVLLNNFPLR